MLQGVPRLDRHDAADDLLADGSQHQPEGEPPRKDETKPRRPVTSKAHELLSLHLHKADA
jgi:hypothetical protein